MTHRLRAAFPADAQAYSIEKEVSGADSVKLAEHLKNLGAAYEKQGKMEAATLTLEEAGVLLPMLRLHTGLLRTSVCQHSGSVNHSSNAR